MNFHWQTEDNVDWDKPITPQPSPPSKWRSWPLALLFLGILALGAVTIYQQVTDRVAAVSDAVRAEVTAAFWLARGTAARQDEELYLTLLSGRDPAWTEAQMALVAANHIGGRAMWDMPAAADPEILDIALSPDLNTATVTVRQPLQVTLPDGRSQTIRVQQIDVFRHGQDRWLLSPPDAAASDAAASDDAFWELTGRSRGRYLTLSYPQRDQAIAERLASDLESDVARLCVEMAAPCDALHLYVTLSPDLHSLADQIDFVSRLQADPQLLLPSPTLVGVPVDEAGYQALRRAYAVRVIGTAINHLVAYDCCAHASLYLALLDLTMQRLGLRPVSLHAGDYAQMLDEDLNLLQLLDRVYGAWLLSPDKENNREFSPIYVQALITFWATLNAETTHLEHLRRLAHAATFTTWAQPFGSGVQSMVSRAAGSQDAVWFRFLFEQAQLAQPDPPVPLPGNSVALMCAGLRGQIIYQYDLAQHDLTQTQEMRAYGGYQILARTQDEQGIILYDLSGFDETGAALVEVVSWNGGQSQRLYADPNASLYALAQYDPTGQYLALLVISREPNATPAAVLLDLADCQAEGCAAQELVGWPIWSPDGQRTLLIDPDGQTWLGDALGQNAGLTPPNPNFGFSLAITWLDNNAYAYALPTASDMGSSSNIYSYALATGEIELLVQTADYISLLPTPLSNNISQITYMATVPQQPQRLIFAANVGTVFNSSQPTAVFTLDLTTRALELLYYEEITTTTYPPFQFSSDGRWLTLLTYQRLNDPISQLRLYDLTDAADTGQVIARGDYVAYDWSADGQWLAVYNDRRLYALAPAFEYERLYMPGQDECHDVVWQQ